MRDIQGMRESGMNFTDLLRQTDRQKDRRQRKRDIQGMRESGMKELNKIGEKRYFGKTQPWLNLINLCVGKLKPQKNSSAKVKRLSSYS